jgi:hypothetical protein
MKPPCELMCKVINKAGTTAKAIRGLCVMDTDTSPGPAAASNPAELALEIYKLLAPHPSETRVRAIQSAMASLGETASLPGQGASKHTTGAAEITGEFGDLNLGPKALRWLQKYGITRAMLEEAFLLGDRVEISANSVPGASKREMTVHCYLLVGLKNLLKADTPSVDDGDAIAECKRMAAYDKNNHTTNRQSVGNKMSGARPNFMLTGPGETAVAALIKQMTAA